MIRPAYRVIALGTVAALIVAMLAGAGGYWLAHRSQTASTSASSDTRQVLYWYDPMMPNQHFDQPGKSPFMDMQLVPRYADDRDADEASNAAASLQIDPGLMQNLGMRVTRVERGSLAQSLDAIGSVSFDQRRVAVVQTRASGFVTRVYARAPGDVLKRGDALVDVLVPEWAGAQAEFLALLDGADAALIHAARQRLLLLGMSESLIDGVVTRRKVDNTVTIRTPRAGVIDTLEVREGMTVGAGTTLAKINGLETVWVEAAIPEAQSAPVTWGRSVEVRLAAYPDVVFRGEVAAVLPEANADTRTVRARVVLDNPDGKLRPGMFAQLHFNTGNTASALQVASEAIIRTGTRNLVLVTDGQGHFTPTLVQLGTEANGKTVILSGLKEGQQVVASSQFLIDSEAKLGGVLARMTDDASASSAGSATMHEAGGLESVDGDKPGDGQ